MYIMVVLSIFAFVKLFFQLEILSRISSLRARCRFRI